MDSQTVILLCCLALLGGVAAGYAAARTADRFRLQGLNKSGPQAEEQSSLQIGLLGNGDRRALLRAFQP